MTGDQTTIFIILAATVVMFAWGKWRHDMVALGALIACVATGLIPGNTAFAGFGHPAVITVACVLILSRGLQASGAVDVLARRLLPADASPAMTIAGLTALAATLSGFMNNVGALALLMPVAIQAAARFDMPPGRMLMPLAFGSILGGMTTLIGTPPNLIVSAFRAETLGEGYHMFDFTPVGLAIAVAGVAFIILFGWRLVPERPVSGVEGFEAGAYITEARVPEKSKAAGLTLRGVEDALAEADTQVIGLIRGDVRLRTPRSNTKVRAGNILVLEAEPEGLSKALSILGLTLEEDVDMETPVEDSDASDSEDPPEKTSDGDVTLAELVITPTASIIGRSATSTDMRSRYQINLLAISRQGRRSVGRIRNTRLQAGDVLLVQGPAGSIAGFAADQGALPLAGRDLNLPDRRDMILAAGIMLAAIASAATGLLPAAVSFAAGVLAMMVTRVVPPRDVYNAVDWPVIVLLGALLPVAAALQSTGAAGLLADYLVGNIAQGVPLLALVLVLVVTMTLSDLMNNAATVAVMAPIALGAANSVGAGADAFLMAVAIGGSCAFLTPIGHQNNTLILGPGGFHFGDYWKLGLPVQIIVVAVAVPMIVLVWGL
jgi:di/tricarboxylate transporter